jgi:hypothetical protein
MKWLDNFKYFNRVKKVNTCCQWILVGMLLFGFQITLSYLHFRFDFSTHHNHALQEISKAFLKTLNAPVKLFVIIKNREQPDHELLRKIRSLGYTLRNELVGNRSQFEYQEVDVLKDPKLYLSLKGKYKIDINSGILLVLSEDCTTITLEELMQNKLFVGEAVIINALAQLASPVKNFYWLTGHGELDGRDNHPANGGSIAHQIFKKMRCDIHFLEFGNVIPEDADGIIIFGPKIPFLPQECTALKQYLSKRHGHIFLCLQPLYEHELNDFLKSLGVTCDSEIVLDSSTDLLNGSGDLLIRRFNPHPLTQPLIDRNIGLVFGLTTRFILKQDTPFLAPCILSSETSWVKNKQNITHLKFNSDSDPVGPHTLGLCYNNLGDDKYYLNLHPNKVVMIGCSEWLNNAHIHLLGNSLLLQSIYHYFENTALLPPHNVITNDIAEKLVISQQTFLTLVLNFLVLPFIFFTVGIVVIVLRKE